MYIFSFSLSHAGLHRGSGIGTDCMVTMNTSQKSLPIIAIIAIALVGGIASYRYANRQPEPPKVVSVEPGDSAASSTEQRIDTSNWKTYRNEDLGLEMKFPPEWSGHMDGGAPYINWIDDYHPFWQPYLGRGYWRSDRISLKIQIKQSTTTLEGFSEAIGHWLPLEKVMINGFSALQYARGIKESTSDMSSSPTGIGKYDSWEYLLIQREDVFYLVEFHENSFSLEDAKTRDAEWQEVLRQMKFFPLSPSARKAIEEWPKWMNGNYVVIERETGQIVDDSDKRQQLETADTTDTEICDEHWNQSGPDTGVPYTNLVYGFQFSIPFNKKWGSENYKIKPYRERSYDEKLSIAFGPVSAGGACGIEHRYELVTLSQRSAVAASGAADVYDLLTEPEIKTVNGLDVVYYEVGELCGGWRAEVVGERYNYSIGGCDASRKEIEDIVSQFKVIPINFLPAS